MNVYGISPHLMAVTAPAAEDLAWLGDAHCRHADLDLFFGPDAEHPDRTAAREAEALKVCAGCPARIPCLGWQLTFAAQYGVAGGMGEDDRRALRHSLLRRYPDGEFPVLTVTRALAAKDHLRVCTGPCGRPLPADQFPRRGGGYRRTACKTCWSGICRQQQESKEKAS